MPKKKKEHYVPQGYLEKWCIPGSFQVNVFDKEKDEIRSNHIEDIASENYFYDLNLEDVFTAEEIKYYDLEGVDLSKIDDEQYNVELSMIGDTFFRNTCQGGDCKVFGNEKFTILP